MIRLTENDWVNIMGQISLVGQNLHASLQTLFIFLLMPTKGDHYGMGNATALCKDIFYSIFLFDMSRNENMPNAMLLAFLY